MEESVWRQEQEVTGGNWLKVHHLGLNAQETKRRRASCARNDAHGKDSGQRGSVKGLFVCRGLLVAQ